MINMEDTEQEEGDIVELTELIKQATPLVEQLIPNLTLNQKSKSSTIKRQQWLYFIILMTILISVGMLTYIGQIDGSAAIGIFGAMAGYIFGNR